MVGRGKGDVFVAVCNTDALEDKSRREGLALLDCLAACRTRINHDHPTGMCFIDFKVEGYVFADARRNYH